MTTEGVKLPAWYDGPPAPKLGMGRALYTTDKHPIFYLMILKCGCTFLRNLLFHIDHDQLHPEAPRIHAYDADFVKAAHIPHQIIRDEGALFAVVRAPMDRFLSLYFDKIADPGNQTDAWMRRRIGKGAGLTLEGTLSIEDHRANCLLMLDWIKRNLDDGTEGKTNPHWQRQSVSVNRIKGFQPHLIPLEHMQEELARLLIEMVPDIKERMAAVTQRNVSTKLFAKSEFVTPELNEMVAKVYGTDADLHRLSLERMKG